MGEAILARNASGGGASGMKAVTGSFKGTNGRVFSINVDFEPSEVHIWCTGAAHSAMIYAIHDIRWTADQKTYICMDQGSLYHYDNNANMITTTYANGLFTLTVASSYSSSYGLHSSYNYCYTVIGG